MLLHIAYISNPSNTKVFKHHIVLFNINLYSAGIDFRRQNLTSVDVGF